MHKNSMDLSKDAQQRFRSLADLPLTVTVHHEGFFTGFGSSMLALWNRRKLIKQLAKRELKSRYKDSVLGYAWTLAKPLVNLLIYYLVIGRILGAERSVPDFAVYVFAGLTLWTFFSTMVNSATTSIVANAGIVKKVYLPREVFPLSAILASFVDFFSQLAILIIGAGLIAGIPLKYTFTYGLLSLAVCIVWALACGLFFSAVNVYLRDVQYIVEVLLMLGFWLTPSVYPYTMLASVAPSWAINIYMLNPTAIASMGFQKAFWAAGDQVTWPPDLTWRLWIMLLVGLVLSFVAQRVFARLQGKFAQEL